MRLTPRNFIKPFLWIVFLHLYALAVHGQNAQHLSVPEIHQIVEKHINYSRDSSLKLLEIASKKIEQEQNKKLSELYTAENNLRRADYWSFYNLDSTLTYLDKAFQYYIQNPDEKKLADIYVLKAQVYRELRDKSRCEAFIDSALYYALRYQDQAFLSFVYYEKAITQQFTEKWEESFENAVMAMKYAELSEDSLSLATAYFLMGRTYHHFGLFKSSESNIALAKEYGEGMSQLYTIIHIYADVLLQNKKTDLALISYKEALQIATEKQDTAKAILLCTNIGQILLTQKEYQGAEAYYNQLNKLLKSKQKAGYKTILFLAQMHYHFGDEEQANADLVLFQSKYGSGTVIPRNIDVYKEAADLHIALNHLDQATVYYKKWGILKDSLYSYTSMQQLNALEELYLNERKKNEEITLKNEELDESRQQQAVMAGLLILVILIGSGLAYYIRLKGIRENDKLKFALKEKQMEQLIEAQETERQRLARELHDGIGQSLAALKMQLQFDKNPSATTTTAHRIDSICDEVRSLSHQMMPIVLKENGLESALEQLLDNSFSTSTVEVDFVSFGLKSRLPDHIEVNIYRITQELVSNILKHAHATKVGVQLLKRGKKLMLIVEDNGIGFSLDDKLNGIGLNNINIRLEAMNGSIQIQSTDGTGTFIHISTPLEVTENKVIA